MCAEVFNARKLIVFNLKDPVWTFYLRVILMCTTCIQSVLARAVVNLHCQPDLEFPLSMSVCEDVSRFSKLRREPHLNEGSTIPRPAVPAWLKTKRARTASSVLYFLFFLDPRKTYWLPLSSAWNLSYLPCYERLSSIFLIHEQQ